MSKKKASPPAPAPTPEPLRKRLFPLFELKSPPLPDQVRIDAGTLLSRVQDGFKLSLPISRPMRSIGKRVHELRLSDEAGEWRIVYRIDEDLILLVDAFKKTAEQTEQQDIERSVKRLKAFDKRVAVATKAVRAQHKIRES